MFFSPDQPIARPGSTTEIVVPRWEWRSFARSFVERQTEPEPPVMAAELEDEETYILSLLSPHQVKVRNGLLQVKWLERTDAAGLELWRPVLAAPFPIGGDALGVACSAWGIEGPAWGEPMRSLAQLLRTIVVPHRQLRIVTLLKRRVTIHIAGCRGERAQITVGRHRWNTVGFEDADPGRVHAALGELHLDVSANQGYPLALKRILGIPDHSSAPSVVPPIHTL